MKNMNDLLRQAQVMQNKIARLQQEMAEKDVEASAGGGMVKVVMNGRQEMKSIVIDKAVMESGDNILYIILSHRSSLIIQAKPICSHIIKPNFVSTAELCFSKYEYSGRNTGIRFKNATWH